jgi:hypothetical protein
MFCSIEGCDQSVEGRTRFCGTHNFEQRKKERDEAKEKRKREKAVRVSKQRASTVRLNNNKGPKPGRINPRSEQGKVRKEAEWKMFREIWEERSPFSEVSGTFLGREYNPSFFAHVVAKGAYEGLRLVKENICLMTPEEHDLYDKQTHKAKLDPKFDWVFEKREELKQAYNQMFKNSFKKQG